MNSVIRPFIDKILDDTRPAGEWACGRFPREASNELSYLGGRDDDGDSHLELVQLMADEIERLQAIAEAADFFLAQPPDDMPDDMPFHQYTTAGDCRDLCKAFCEWRKAADAAGGK